MHTDLPDYIVQRVRRPIPANSSVVPGSTPVLSFGNVQRATVATLGLNPSVREFLDKNGAELAGPSRRLSTCQSLGIKSLSCASDDTVRQVVEECNAYFQGKPYNQWFNQLESILAALKVSYKDSSACHLDLVQWATNPTWSRLKPANVRSQLLRADGPFLLEQLRNEKIKLLLVNGKGAFVQLQKLTAMSFREKSLNLSVRVYQKPVLFVGTLFGHVRVVGWSTNLQSSFGVTNELRSELACRVAEIVRSERLLS
jgi:hypothetical protein